MRSPIFLISLLFAPLLANNNAEHQDFLKSYKQEFETYKQNRVDEFEAYQKAYEDSLSEYTKSIAKKWPKKEISTKHKFVQYNEDFNIKKSVNFENSSVNIEVFAKTEQEARQKIKKALEELSRQSVKDAYSQDQLEMRINQILKRDVKLQNDSKIIADVLTPIEKEKFIQSASKNDLKMSYHNNETLFSLNVKLPPNTTVKKAQAFKEYINKYSQIHSVNKDLIYAIMHSESFFNPMARSHIPAYGLMQIVPKSAGVDAYNFLYGQKRLLSSEYLYSPNNNVELGVAYLHMLYYKYLQNIDDPMSRLYCAIAAYNTGAGNVARSFIGNTNIAQASSTINRMTSDQVYNHLLRNLPYSETRKYLKKVNDQRFVYQKLLESKTL